MVAEKQIDEFVSRMKQAAGQNLQSIILYGSAATGEYQTDFSNLNLLCVLRESSFSKLSAIAPVVDWWHRQKHPAPLVMTQEELERSADVFSIELLDMQHHHRMLFGEELLTPLQIPMQQHRAQLEYELREKLILLRQRLLRLVTTTAPSGSCCWVRCRLSRPCSATRCWRWATQLPIPSAKPSRFSPHAFLSNPRLSCNCWISVTTRRTASNSTPKTFSPATCQPCST